MSTGEERKHVQLDPAAQYSILNTQYSCTLVNSCFLGIRAFSFFIFVITQYYQLSHYYYYWLNYVSFWDMDFSISTIIIMLKIEMMHFFSLTEYNHSFSLLSKWSKYHENLQSVKNILKNLQNENCVNLVTYQNGHKFVLNFVTYSRLITL